MKLVFTILAVIVAGFTSGHVAALVGFAAYQHFHRTTV